MVDTAHCMTVARTAAQAAAEILRSYFHGSYKRKSKADGSPVTEADIAAEDAIREILLGEFPDHGFYGEEGDATGMGRECIWLVDPLDGTKSFISRTPFFSTQIALQVAGELVVGVSSAPAFDELAAAHRGGGASLNGSAVSVSNVAALKSARVSTGNIQSLAASDKWSGLGRLLAQVNRTRGYGDFYHYHLLARGEIDLVVESDLNILDIAALTVIVREAGGVVTELDGGPIGLNTRSILAGNPRIHSMALEILHG